MADVTLNVRWYASWYSVYANATANEGFVFYSLCRNGRTIPHSLSYKNVNGTMWAVLTPSNKVPGTYQLCVKVTGKNFKVLKTYTAQVQLPKGAPPGSQTPKTPPTQQTNGTTTTQPTKSTVYTSISVSPETQAVQWPSTGKLPEASFTLKTDKGTPVPYVKLTIYLNNMKRAETPIQPLGKYGMKLSFGTVGEYKIIFTGYDEAKRPIGQATAYVQVLPPVKNANNEAATPGAGPSPAYSTGESGGKYVLMIILGASLLLLRHKG